MNVGARGTNNPTILLQGCAINRRATEYRRRILLYSR